MATKTKSCNELRKRARRRQSLASFMRAPC